MKKLFQTRKNRVIALVLAAALLVGSLATGLAVTLAETKWQYRLKQQSTTINVLPSGSPFTFSSTGLSGARLTDTTLGSFSKVGSDYIFTPNGTKTAGIAQIVRVNRTGGFLQDLSLQVADADKITGYDLPNEGNGFVSKVSDDPINLGIKYYKSPAAVIPNGQPWAPNESNITTYNISNDLANDVKWESLDPEILFVASDNRVYAKAEGITMLLGTFTDRWGVEQHIHFVFGVGTAPGKSNNTLSKLLDAIQKGQTILDLDPNPYKEEGLGVLQDAVEAANGLLDDGNLNEAALQGAITAIENAIAGLEPAATGGEVIITVPGGGKYKRPSGPPHVYEVLDPETGESLEPPEYIYDPSDGLAQDPPELGDNTLPAYKDDYIYYAEAEPPGSNIFYKIDPNTGELDTANPIWGGADKRPGGGNDSKAYYDEDGDAWYAEDPAGSNLWKPVLTAESNGANQGNVNATKNTWRGGGEDGKPGTLDDLFPITVVDGITVAGGPTWATGDDLYYIGAGDDGRFDTSGHNGSGRPKNDVVLDSDVKYRYVDGKLVPDDIVDPEDSSYKYVYVETDPALGDVYEKVTNPGGSSLNPAEYYINEDGEWVQVWPDGNGGWTKTKPATAVKPSNINTSNVTPATVGSPYSATLTADGDAATWTVSNGSLPSGLSLSTAGVISGTPSAPGTYEFTVKAKNAGGEDTKVLSIVVSSAAPTVTVTGFSADSGYLKADGTNTTLIGNVLVMDDDTGLEEWVPYEAAHGTLTWALDPAGQPATISANHKFIKQTDGTAANTIITVKGTLVTSDGTYTATCNWVVPNEDGTIGGGGTDEPMGVTGRTLATTKTDDTSVWIEVAQTVVDGKLYSLIVRKDTIGNSKFHASSNVYSGSTARTAVNDWFRNDNNLTTRLDWSAKLRNYTVTSDVMNKIGAFSADSLGWDKFGTFDGFSNPTGVKDNGRPTGEAGGKGTADIAFLLSFGEAARFISKQWWFKSTHVYVSNNAIAIANWNKLNNGANTSVHWWIRSPLTNANHGAIVRPAGWVAYSDATGYDVPVSTSCGLRPACWVDSTIFDS